MHNMPGFLIIGAMKAGTTSLYDDLTRVSGIYMPPEKEPEDLIHDAVETLDGLARYRAKFAAAHRGDICGEASTAYSKLPIYQGVAQRARRLLGPDLRVIYMRREPIKRIVSQYHHLWGLGLENRPINRAVLEDETYVAYSQYERQIAPWRDAFGDKNILLIDFEDYIGRRQETLARVCAFLGRETPKGVNETHRNRSEGKRVTRPGSFLARLRVSPFYLYRIKPLLPTGLRDKIKAAVLPKARRMTDTLTAETEAELRKRLQR